jgi:transposase InsO family protein
MSWDIQDIIGRRHEFVTLALAGGVGMAELCRRFGISRKTGYKWRKRFVASGAPALVDQPQDRTRPGQQTPARTEAKVLALRRKYPTWGPRKLHRRLLDLGHPTDTLPAVSTFGRILSRAGCISPHATLQHQPGQRFSRPEPNQLWQMDFKGHFALQRQGRCHPLTVLDDCSRFSVGLQACADEQTPTVQSRLQRIFTLYGLPECILCDNGPPWAGSGPEHSVLTVWLLRLGIAVIHGRPYHPQTQGKDERFHRTLKADLLDRHDWRDLAQAQRRFDRYRQLYNHDRPHEALGLAVPATRYHPSSRPMPRELPPVEYGARELVRPVKSKGEITFGNRFYYIGHAFAGLPVALRPTATDGIYRVCLAAFTLGIIDCGQPSARPKGHYHPLQPLSSKVLPSTRDTCYP